MLVAIGLELVGFLKEELLFLLIELHSFKKLVLNFSKFLRNGVHYYSCTICCR